MWKSLATQSQDFIEQVTKCVPVHGITILARSPEFDFWRLRMAQVTSDSSESIPLGERGVWLGDDITGIPHVIARGIPTNTLPRAKKHVGLHVKCSILLSDFFKVSFYTILPSKLRPPNGLSSFTIFQLKCCVHLSSFQFLLHALPISFSLRIWLYLKPFVKQGKRANELILRKHIVKL
jgi:hypothetical protein